MQLRFNVPENCSDNFTYSLEEGKNCNKKKKCGVECGLNLRWSERDINECREEGSSDTGLTKQIMFNPPLDRCTSSQEADFAPSHHFKTIGFLQVQSCWGKPSSPVIPEFQTGFHLSRKYLHSIVFLLILPSVPYRSEIFLKQPVQHCSNIKVTGGDLSCRGAVRLTVTQLTDSQTTRDPCSYFFFHLPDTPFCISAT